MNHHHNDNNNTSDWTFTDLNTTTHTRSSDVVWTIPAGNIDHAKMVSTVTAMSVLVGAVVVLSAFITTAATKKGGGRRGGGRGVRGSSRIKVV